MAIITSSYTPKPIGEKVLRTNYVPGADLGDASEWNTWRCAAAVSEDATAPGGRRLTLTTSEVGYFPRAGTLSIATTEGDQWTVSAYVLPVPAARVCLGVQFLGTTNITTWSEYSVDGDETLTVTATAPAGTSSVRSYFALESDAPVGTEASFAAPMMEQSAEATPFFSSATPAEGDVFYRERPGGGAQEVLTLFDSVTETEPRLVLGYETDREAGTIVHHVLDRTDPDVSLRPAGMRSGTLNLFYLTEQEAYDAEVMHSMPARFHFDEPDRPTASMAYVVTEGRLNRRLDDETRNRWILSVPFAEVLP